MAYATMADMIEEFGADEMAQLTQRGTEPEAAPHDAIGERALDFASQEINSRVAGRYAIELTPVPARVRAACCDIARYRLYRSSAPETVRERFDDAMRWLDQVATGRAALLADDGTPMPTASADTAAAVSSVAGSTRTLVFGADFVSRFAPGIGS